MEACGTAGLAVGLDIGRPRVPEFGRKLYRLPVRRRLPDQVVGSVERKLRGVGGVSGIADLRTRYEGELQQWTESLEERRFKAVVLDYDGTMCSTQRRFQPPSPDLTKRLVSLLEEGLLLGFASGRGPSLPEALKVVIPEPLWPQITVGMYNGGALYQLDEELANHKSPSALIMAAKDRLASLPIAQGLKLTARREQLTVEVAQGTWLKDGLLLELVNDALQRAPAVDVKVVASAHSVDVVSPFTSKVSVIQRLSADLLKTDVLCIGDQGQVGGNDFELLAEQPWSLSVDRTSADPTRCWFLGDGRRSGPELLQVYLSWLGKRREGFAFKVNGR
jgi:hydroxymethylpyrimidine pyrophosphatase-like HAD family hydrolase